MNPVVLVEVLSPSTAEYCITDKLYYYKQIPSLREIVHVDFVEQRLAIWRKGFANGWSVEELTSGTTTLESIGCTLSIDDVYRNELPAS